MRQIGTIELLRTRVYPLDPMNRANDATTVVVDPGRYPLYEDGISIFWVMTGRVNVGLFSRLGDGMFMMGSHDQPSDVEVKFPSPTFGPDEWDDFLAQPHCKPGHPEQRFIIRTGS